MTATMTLIANESYVYRIAVKPIQRRGYSPRLDEKG